MHKDVNKIFGSKVFNDKAMKEYLPQDTYKMFKQNLKDRISLDLNNANVIAEAMKSWAIANGANHFTHWFQPLTGVTAEKHTSFVDLQSDGSVIMDFSGKELIKGEPDASSFPHGGLRTTFEARGYTAWDPSSFAFIKDDTLCIPTLFYSYSGLALDKKTPLLRSIDALEKQTLRILKLFGHEDVKSIHSTVGAEQEYFLIDRELYRMRPDLMHCGRTLFGAKAIKGQDLEDHYFGTIHHRVSAYMKDLEEQLWALGVPAKAKHNEVAPSQHEFAPIFTDAGTALDQNQLTMELMKSVASQHDLKCLLHEKPFDGINGSGKHINWSLSTDTGINLLDPGDTPYDNAQFLLFLTAVVKAVDEHQDLLRASVASASNDHRLGGNEAPPAIISIFLGEDLTAIFDAIENNEPYIAASKKPVKLGVSLLPPIPRDVTDRNRTSPFTFTGNKFEFRMPGSSGAISTPTWVLNTIIADTLEQFADTLEKSANLYDDLQKLIKDTIHTHKRIIFNGNNYSKEWEEEAEKRGLYNLKNTPDALQSYLRKENFDMIVRQKVLNDIEIKSRYEVFMESYYKILRIEAMTFIDMVQKSIIPDVILYKGHIKKALDGDDSAEGKILKCLNNLTNNLYDGINELIKSCDFQDEDSAKMAAHYRDVVLVKMNSLRKIVDCIEVKMPKSLWSLPTYEGVPEQTFSLTG